MKKKVCNFLIYHDEKRCHLKQEKERIAAKRAKMNAEETGDRNQKKLLSTTAGCNFDERNDESVSSPTE